MEEQGLYMLQLWADTFMMYQDTYPGFQKYFRELKVEGINFPQRLKMEETIMNNLEGINSPMYEFVLQAEKKRDEEPPSKKSISEQERKSNSSQKRTSNLGRKSSLNEIKEDPFEAEDKIDMDPDIEIADINMKLKELEDNHDYVEDELKFIEEIESASYKKYQNEDFDKAIFELSKSHFDRLDDMLTNCEAYSDIVTDVIIEMFEAALKGKMKCEKVMQVRKANSLEGADDKDARESLIHMNLKINDFKEKYYLLKDRQIREYNKAKRTVEKRKRKIQKENERAERRRKRREDKLAKLQKQQKAANPFDVNDDENAAIGTQPIDMTIISDSDTESSHSDSSESEKSNIDSDEDGLHAPKTMHEIRVQEMERKRVKNNKKRDKEIKKILRDREKKRQTTFNNTAAQNGGGFLRSSVLVQKTLNFFGRGSKPKEILAQDSDDEEDIQAVKIGDDENEDNHEEVNDNGNNENDPASVEKKSDQSPKLNEFFVQTSTQQTASKSEDKENF